jgi:hypothetical protein
MKLSATQKYDLGAKFLDYMNSPDDRRQLLDWVFEEIESLKLELPSDGEISLGVGCITFMRMQDSIIFENGAKWMRDEIEQRN